MRILGIETSCDETAAAVGEITERPNNQSTKQPVVPLFSCSVLSSIVASQIKIHQQTGGVVPEVAARAHVEAILPVVKMAMKNAECRMKNLGSDIDAIAVTAGPGLATSLLVGVETARALAWLWKKPVVAVNHLAGHVYANWLPSPQSSPAGRGSIENDPSPLGRGQGEGGLQFPILCLIVSGGHTELVLMRKHLVFKIIGSTRDDAAGEAFDKVAKMLGLGYPGGPIISALAEKCRMQNVKCRMIEFPRPMIDAPNFDFSFSGLKTAVLYYIKTLKHTNIKTLLPQICFEFQEAVVDVLVAKTVRAAKKYQVKTVLLGGGVAANARLRQRLIEVIPRELPTTSYILPSLQYATDNAAMIAAAGYFMARAKQFTPWQKLEVNPHWKLDGTLAK